MGKPLKVTLIFTALTGISLLITPYIILWTGVSGHYTIYIFMGIFFLLLWGVIALQHPKNRISD